MASVVTSCISHPIEDQLGQLLGRGPVRLEQVLDPDSRGQPEADVVGLAHELGGVVEGGMPRAPSEDLLGANARVGLDADQHRRLHEVAAVAMAHPAGERPPPPLMPSKT
jgi:hypothetical protein